MGQSSSAPTPQGVSPLTDTDPRNIGDYTLMGRLGSGGMGTAYLATRDSTFAVIKVIHPHIAATPEFTSRLDRELQAMHRATGPRTAAILSQDLTATPPWFAMEYVDGRTLADHVAAFGPLSGSHLEQFSRDLAHALTDIHAAGIIHRDLKPSNIMLTSSGPRIIDFGIADIEGATQLTSTGTVLGTMGWLAPEQITGDPVTTATDVHAWGLCVLYAATGQNAYPAASSASAVYAIVHTDPAIPTTLPPALANRLHRALAKDPQQRPTTSELGMQLNSGSSARPQSRRPRLHRSRPHRSRPFR